MNNFVVTGVAGFIGSHLAERLILAGHHVIGIDNFDPFYAKSIKLDNLSKIIDDSKFSLFELDVRTEEFALALSNIKVDTIIHLSARAGVRPSLLSPKSSVHHDIEATVNIFETCRKLDISNLIFGRSSSVYGNMTELPYKEDMNLSVPISPYAAAKLSCELFNHVYHSQYGLNITNLRFFTIYGPRQRPEMGIHKFTSLIDQNKEITMYGDGTTSRDYTYIDDIIDGIVQASQKIKGYHTYNLGNNEPVVLSDLIELISKSLGVTPLINKIDMQLGDVDHTLADTNKAKSEIGYNPRISIQEGLERFVKWYKNNKNRVDKK